MTETVTLSIEQLEQLIDQRLRQRGGGVPAGPGVLDDPEMAPLLGVPPRSQPVHGAKAMEEIAKQRGGLWSADNPAWRKYGGVIITRGGQRKVVEQCPHATPANCDQCWTPETETRWAFALGLTDDPPDVPLDRPEAPRSQRANEPTRSAETKRLGGRAPANMPG